ncbi:MAG: hypothetical protein J7K84_00820 [Deltaproteobacteria bacterium]|nr:hypothetical protein [Deltaproteobacteria bacterium]
MFIETFNKAWEKERKKIELRLTETFEKEIKSLLISAKSVDEDENDKEFSLELKKKRAELILRKSLVTFESEKIAKERMQLRMSYIAIILSSTALVVSILSVLTK